MLHAHAIPTLLLFGLGQVADAAPPRRYVSSQAYYHTVRAELAEAQDDLTTAADELSLALVYDAKSVFLTERLARLSLRLGRHKKARRLVDQAKASGRVPQSLHLLDAEVARAAKDWRKAERALRRAVRLDRSEIKPALLLGELLAERGRRAEAMRVLKRASRANPQAAEPLGMLAGLAAAAREYETAADALERAILRDPDDLQYRLRLDALYERLERGLEGADRLLAFSADHPADAEAALAAGEALVRVGRDAEAERVFEGFAQRHQDRMRPVGEAWLRQGRFRKAQTILSQSLRAPSPADHLNLGRALFGQGQWGQAVRRLNRIKPSAQEFVAAQILMARALVQKSKTNRARIQIERAASARPSSALRALELRFAWLRQDKLQKRDFDGLDDTDKIALVEWLAMRTETQEDIPKELLASLPSRTRAQAVAQVWAAQGDPKRALAVVQSSWRSAGTPLQWARWARWRWSVKGDPSWAQAAFRRAPRRARTIAVYGATLIGQGEIAHAMDVLDRGVRLHPYEPELHERRGDAFRAQGQPGAARAAYQRALKTMLEPFDGASPRERQRVIEKLKEIQ